MQQFIYAQVQSRHGRHQHKMADYCRRLCCCINCPQIHPLHNIIDIRNTGQSAVSLPDDLVSHSLETITVPGKRTVEITDQTAVITPLHAAAVNGDKASLNKLLNCGWSDKVDTTDRFGRSSLSYSVLGDRPDCAELLIKAGADTNKKDILGRTALHWAAHKGNVNCVKLLLARGANWKEKDNDGQTPVHLCTRQKSAKCLALLLKNIEPGAIDDQDINKRTALHLAALSGNLEQVQILIKQDSNIAIPDIEGKTPLHWAAGSKDPEAVSCVQLILETTPSVINWQDYEGCTALHLAVADGNEAVVAALLSIDTCNVNALDNMFRSPLHWAAVLGYSTIVNMLFDGKADYASSDSTGATPLHYAALNDFAETVEIFLSRSAVKDEPDNEGRTAFLWAAAYGANAVISCFIRLGVDLLQMDKTGATAMHTAAAAGHASTVRLLLLTGGSALVETTDLSKRTPLSRACEMGRAAVVETLIDSGAKVNDVRDQDGQSMLHWAAFGGHADVCLMLLKYGIDPNICDLAGRTPLHCAAYRGNVNCLSVLLEHKADCNVRDQEGATSLHFACSKGYIDAIKLLVQYNALINNMEFTEDRYTPLDYALMGEHFEVAQYMIEHGAVSITGIQDIAALKIQAWFRGYRVRKTFIERKRLLMRHEQLRKDAAKRKLSQFHVEATKDTSGNNELSVCLSEYSRSLSFEEARSSCQQELVDCSNQDFYNRSATVYDDLRNDVNSIQLHFTDQNNTDLRTDANSIQSLHTGQNNTDVIENQS